MDGGKSLTKALTGGLKEIANVAKEKKEAAEQKEKMARGLKIMVDAR